MFRLHGFRRSHLDKPGEVRALVLEGLGALRFMVSALTLGPSSCCVHTVC